MKDNEFNFITWNVNPVDTTLFFDADENDDFIMIQEHWIMAHIMVEAGIFPSVSQARKNGWNIPIPENFSQFIVGKKKRLVTILNQK